MSSEKLTHDLNFIEAFKDVEISNDSSESNSSDSKNNQLMDIKLSVSMEFYEKAQKYWSEIPATVNGMLGGLGFISTTDINGSKIFLRDLNVTNRKLALDCGAGIGRVSKNLLMPLYDVVDLVEQDPIFAKKAYEYCTAEDNSTCQSRIGQIFNIGLQQFTPQAGKYDLVWSQWVLGHLTDIDLLEFFRRILIGLSEKSYFVIKENVTSSNVIETDETDSSLTRPLGLYKKILKKAGFRIIRVSRQQNFPTGLYPVYMIACKPRISV